MAQAPGMRYRGVWSSSATYRPQDVVTLSGGQYIAVATNTNQTPPNATYWSALGAASVVAADPANNQKFLETVSGSFAWTTLGSAAALGVGTASNTVAAGDDSRLSSYSGSPPFADGVPGQVVYNTANTSGSGPVGWQWVDASKAWLGFGTVSPVGIAAPSHPVAVQGPTDPANLYAIVTWDRNVGTATGYQVWRDGTLIGTTTDGGAATDWDKRYYKDTGVTAGATHEYRVKAVGGSGAGPFSQAARVVIRASSPSKTFDVSTYTGADIRAKIANALIDARASGATYASPAVLYFPAGTYTLPSSDTTGTFSSTEQNIIMRGAGTATIFAAGFVGSSVESGLDNILFKWPGSTTPLSGVNPTSSVTRGTRTVTLNTAAAFSVGDKIALNQITGATTSADDNENYDAWDVNIVESIAGNVVTVRYPWAKPFTTAASVLKLTISGCGIEQCTLQGLSSSEQSYYTLLVAEHTSNHTFAECTFQYCNRNAIYTRGYKHKIVGCTFTHTDPRADGGESFRYVITAGRGSRLTTIGCVFGDLDRVSSSFMTTQVSHKQVVRHNQFRRSVHYGWNCHGSGDYWDVVENNYFYMPECDKGGVFLGNSSFFYAGPTRIRGNLFDACKTAAVACQQNTYGAVIVDNYFRDCVDDLVNWYGSQFASMGTATYGSARFAVKRNIVTSTTSDRPARGMVFGQSLGSNPYVGIRDLIIANNVLDVDASAILFGGNSTQSYNLQVYNNTGKNDYLHPTLISGDYWAGNMDGTATVASGSDGTPYFSDTFSGSASASAGWPVYMRSTTTGTGSDFTVSSSGNYGRLSATSATSGARKTVVALRSEVTSDSVQLVDFRNSTATIPRIQGVVARHGGGTANDDHYRAVYEYGTGVTNRVRLEKVISGTATTLAQTTSLDAALTHDIRFRFEVSGSTVRCNAWDSSTVEPGGWVLTTTDSAITANGKSGIIANFPDATTESADNDNYKLVNWTRAAQADYGTATPVAWESETFTWEQYDTKAEVG